MGYTQFKVEKLRTTPSGNYVGYTSSTGVSTFTHNYGFAVGDLVEMWDFDGYAPSKINVNGKTIWTEDDRIKFWKDYDPDAAMWTNPFRKKQ